MISARVTVQAGDGGVAPGQACLCVGIDIAGRAPGQELVRVEVDPVDDPALGAEALLGGLGLFHELVVAGREQIGVGHHRQHPGVVLTATDAGVRGRQ